MPSLREFLHGPILRGPWRAVLVLGVTQILAWGTIFYTPVLIVPLIAAEHSWSMAFSMAGFSVCLLVAGLIAPFVGRSIDRFGGHVVMTAGSLIGALGLALLAYVDTPIAYFAVWVVLGTALSASLYDAAFGTLGRIFGAAARRPITALTLAGGFASTAGWPATHFLIEAVGWRGTYLVYAALLALVAAPRVMVTSPLAPPNISAKAAATGTETPSTASITNAHSKVPSAKRTTHSGCRSLPKENSINRAPTCAGPNSAPIHTTVPASMPAREKIASRCADRPDGTKA
jgi:MFS family permease